jgi:Ca2+-binding EF-hand superfamily protein
VDLRAPLGRITRYELADFVRDHYTAMSEADLDAIIRRCDTDEDEAINFTEF